MATISQILSLKWPGSQWVLPSERYAALIWLSEGEKPTEAEIMAHAAEVDAEQRRYRMVVTPRQFRLALLAAGLLDDAEAIVADAETPRAVKVAWEYAVSIERMSPFIDQFAAVMGKSAAEVDAIFDAAAEL